MPVHDLTVKVVETELDINSNRYLFGTELDKRLHTTNSKRINIISYIIKEMYLCWNHRKPPSIKRNFETGNTFKPAV